MTLSPSYIHRHPDTLTVPFRRSWSLSRDAMKSIIFEREALDKAASGRSGDNKNDARQDDKHAEVTASSVQRPACSSQSYYCEIQAVWEMTDSSWGKAVIISQPLKGLIGQAETFLCRLPSTAGSKQARRRLQRVLERGGKQSSIQRKAKVFPARNWHKGTNPQRSEEDFNSQNRFLKVAKRNYEERVTNDFLYEPTRRSNYIVITRHGVLTSSDLVVYEHTSRNWGRGFVLEHRAVCHDL